MALQTTSPSDEYARQAITERERATKALELAETECTRAKRQQDSAQNILEAARSVIEAARVAGQAVGTTEDTDQAVIEAEQEVTQAREAAGRAAAQVGQVQQAAERANEDARFANSAASTALAAEQDSDRVRAQTAENEARDWANRAVDEANQAEISANQATQAADDAEKHRIEATRKALAVSRATLGQAPDSDERHLVDRQLALERHFALGLISLVLLTLICGAVILGPMHSVILSLGGLYGALVVCGTVLLVNVFSWLSVRSKA